jgi:tRNA-binding EMAP/Myf-like protein
MKIDRYSLTAVTGALVIVFTNLLPAVANPAIAPKKLNSFPKNGKVLTLTNGDLMCYVDISKSGKKYHLGADFSICEQSKSINQRVELTYKARKVNDCQSNEPCGKTRIENLIVKMKLIK